MKLAVFALAAAWSTSTAGGVILGDARIGGFRVQKDGTLAGATAALGKPSSKRLRSDICYVRWASAGVRMTFYNLGGANPCGPRGNFGTATITGAGWRTSKGLRIGASVAEVRKYFPRATYKRDAFFGDGWWLVTRYSGIGTGGYYPGLLARTANGRVTAFVVRYPAGGD